MINSSAWYNQIIHESTIIMINIAIRSHIMIYDNAYICNIFVKLSTLWPYYDYTIKQTSITLQWRHNGRDSVSNHQPYVCLINSLFKRRSRKHQSSASLAFVRRIHRSGEFPAQMASDAVNVSIWWRHHEETSMVFNRIAQLCNSFTVTSHKSPTTGLLCHSLVRLPTIQHIEATHFWPFVRGVHRWPVDSPPPPRKVINAEKSVSIA